MRERNKPSICCLCHSDPPEIASLYYIPIRNKKQPPVPWKIKVNVKLKPNYTVVCRTKRNPLEGASTFVQIYLSQKYTICALIKVMVNIEYPIVPKTT
jgi:hypothetical protein